MGGGSGGAGWGAERCDVMHRPTPERTSVSPGLGQGNEHDGPAWLPGAVGVMGINGGAAGGRRSQTPGEGAGAKSK